MVYEHVFRSGGFGGFWWTRIANSARFCPKGSSAGEHGRSAHARPHGERAGEILVDKIEGFGYLKITFIRLIAQKFLEKK